MKKYTEYVSPFQGNGVIDLPAPTFPASTWHFIKGLSGNTNPAAVLPFGKYSCLAYDRAYPTGYGLNMPNSGEKIKMMYDRKKFIGLSHFHHSGTGAIRVYYNYAVTCPYYGDTYDFSPRDIISEEAVPGYYSASIDGIRAEATVSEKAVLHRYTFERDGGHIAIDFANDGLFTEEMRGAASGTVRVVSRNELAAEMTLSGVKLYFSVMTDGEVVYLFEGDEKLGGGCAVLSESEDRYRSFGAVINTGKCALVRLAISARSAEAARELCAGECRTFDEVREAARERWEDMLSRVEIETDDSREAEIFYSNLYHTIIKPADFSGEAFHFDSPDGDMVLDIATMWDIYKTQLPFLFTFYPEISKKLLGTLERFGDKYGYLPHCLLLSSRLDIEASQAKMLAEFSIADAYLRGIEADYAHLLELSEADAARFSEFFGEGSEFASHTLDMAEAFTALAAVARGVGQDERAERFAEYGRRVMSAFDADGMMRESSPYYEGNRYNYSFRPLADMKTRIDTFGRERIEAEALRFFGYTDAEELTSRFEGFNNETDMEAPYFLYFLGRHDLLCEVIRSGLDSMFTTGSGGIPGNADSGGLTACYIWSALGLFPLSGQDKMILVTPRYSRSVLHTHMGRLEIIREGDGVYMESACLNGRVLDKFEMTVGEMMRGGRLVIRTK